jgi:hypothetical protein
MCDFPARQLLQHVTKAIDMATNPAKRTYACGLVIKMNELAYFHQYLTGCQCFIENGGGAELEQQAINAGIASIPTTYSGVNFRSRLEARYAAFFNLVGWEWEYEPLDLKGWIPDFQVKFACDRCSGHCLLAEVKPYHSIEEFRHTVAYPLAISAFGGPRIGEYAGPTFNGVALFGNNPGISYWEMTCGYSGGYENGWEIEMYIPSYKDAWKKAGNIVQWRAA